MEPEELEAGAPPAASGACLVVRYAEIGLKGRNRSFFEQRLLQNIRGALRRYGKVRVRREWGRILVFPGGDFAPVLERLRDVFGIASFSPAVAVEKETAAIESCALRVLAGALAKMPGEERVPFRVEADRADKKFPSNSMEVNRRLGALLLSKFPRLQVNLSHPALTLGVEIREEGAYVYADRIPGPGGLPVGVSGRVLCLISGGIDSPVAAWLCMKRGCEVVYATFHSSPFIGEASKERVIDLVRHLARFQGRSFLYVAPFAAVQTEIRKASPEPYRTVLYRRMMQRIAARIAERERCRALVTGESLGQVASQTLENLRCIEDASEMTVLRPLVTNDKMETVALAERIGTFPISIRPAEDCCTVFQPERPVIRGTVRVCREVEASFEVDRLVEESLAGCEFYELAWGRPDPVRVRLPAAPAPVPIAPVDSAPGLAEPGGEETTLEDEA